MIVTINVTVSEGHPWQDDTVVRKEAEVKAEALTDFFPWDLICAGLVEGALKEWQAKQQAKEEAVEEVTGD